MSLLNYLSPVRSLNPTDKRNTILCAVTFFLILFSYQIIRVSTDAFFLHNVGAIKSPYAWLFSVLALSIAVFLYNKFQKYVKIQTLFLYTAILTIVFFTVCISMLQSPSKDIFAYILFIWKEVYIMLLLHTGFAFLNASLNFKTAKILYGPVGAMNTLGSVLGGAFVASIAKSISMEWLYIVGLFGIVLSVLTFMQTRASDEFISRYKQEDEDLNLKRTSPLESIKGAGKYIFLIVLVMGICQIVISLMTYKFNIVFTEVVPDQTEKVAYLGTLNFFMNGISFLCMVFVMPLALRYIKNKYLHSFLPCFFLLLVLLGIFGPASSLASIIMFSYVVFRGLDYSMFQTLKELLYFPLTIKQKFGAKYIVDMLAYRFSKGLISTALILLSTIFWTNILLIFFLCLWPVALYFLFREQKKVLDKVQSLNIKS